MSNITKQLEFIKTAQYGRDVRQSIYEAIDAVNSGAEGSAAAAERAKTGAETAKTGAETAKTGAETAKAAAERAKTGAETAKTGAETAKTGAETAKAAAERAKTGAETAKTGAETAKTGAETAKTGAEAAQMESQENAKMSESWAIGGTGLREGEDTNCGMFYAKMAEQAAARGGWISFEINNKGLLVMRKRSISDVNFVMKNGVLGVILG